MATLRPSLSLSITTNALWSARSAFRRRPLAFSLSSAQEPSSEKQQQQLVLYSKKGCCLCDGLKEKLDAAFCLAGPHSIHHVDLQVRDISTNPEWEKLYQYEIPVLAIILPDGSEQTLPRLSPRLSVELLQKKIAAAFSDDY